MDLDLLVLTYAYPPMRFPRSIQIARALTALSPERTAVVCAEDPPSADEALLDVYPDGGRLVRRVGWTPAARAYLRSRDRLLETRLLVPDRFRPWLRGAARVVREERLLERTRVVATFGQPMSVHLLGLRLRRRRRVPWIAHFSDPWVDNPFRADDAIARRLNLRLQRQVVEEADLLVFTSEETVDLVLSRYPSRMRAKARVLPHAHDERLYPQPAVGRDGIVIRHLGAFYGNRGPQHLLDALRVLQADDPETVARLRVELVGPRELPLAPDAIAGLPPELVRLVDPVPYLESLRLMRDSDVLLVLDAAADQSVFLPSKLVDYIGARRPVVALTPPGAAADLVRRYGGWVADPRDAAAGAAALRRAIAAARKEPTAAFGDATVVAEHALGHVASSFAALVAEAAATETYATPR